MTWTKQAERKSGIELIAQEREEQFSKHKRTISQDAIDNSIGELKHAAVGLCTGLIEDMPSEWGLENCKKMLAKSEIERLTIAGALIAAEIDRLIIFGNGEKEN